MKKKPKPRYKTVVLWESECGGMGFTATRIQNSDAYTFKNYTDDPVTITVTTRKRIKYR